MMCFGIILAHIVFEQSGCVIHRSAHKACERKNSGVARLASAESLILRTACRLIADEVWPCAAYSGGTHSLMSIDHYLIVGGFLHSILVMVYKPLAEMVASCRDYVANISAFYGIIAVVLHKLICLVHAALVITH